ncbi:DUF3422 family protein [Maricaulis sp.]|uniref:DUF3422 family protein n=1 Tax=Maricaulis sp. TaxID=1486257 RepID=UPI003A9363B8
MTDHTKGSPRLKFEYPRDFGRLNAEAQRRHPDQVRPPYLTWHFACWPKATAGGSRKRKAAQSDFVTEKQGWLEEINAFLDRLGAPAGDRLVLAGGTNGSDARVPFVQRDTFTFYELGAERALVLRCEYHTEYVSFTFYQPVSAPQRAPLEEHRTSPGAEPGRYDPFTNEAFLRTNPQLDQLVDEVFEAIRRQPEESAADYMQRAGEAWDRLFTDAWAKVPDSDGKPHPFQAPGQVFANYRGIVLPRIWLAGAGGQGEMDAHLAEWGTNAFGERFIETDLADDRPTVHMPLPEKKGEELDPPSRPRRWNRVSAGRALERNTALRHAMHWPGAKPPSDIVPAYRRRTVANLVLHGRALFASSFGAGLPVEPPRKGSLPADPNRTAGRFAIFYCAEHSLEARTALERRLDRLVLRIHSLGTLRMISLKSLDQLWNASYQLREVDASIGRLYSTILKRKDVDNKEIRAISRALFDVTGGVEDGLDYRLSRSAYYARDFKRLLDDISIDRIEGWEPYDEFVRRRLMPQWDHLHQIARRADGVRSRFDRLHDLNLASNTERLTNGAVLLGAFAVVATISATTFAGLGDFTSCEVAKDCLVDLGEVAAQVSQFELNQPDRHLTLVGLRGIVSLLVGFAGLLLLRIFVALVPPGVKRFFRKHF